MALTFEAHRNKALPVSGSPPAPSYFLDEKLELYHYYGMYSAGFWDIWGPKTWLAYLRIILKGARPQKSHGDIQQRGGDILIDPKGIIKLHHIGSGPSDRPSPQTIFNLIRSS